MNNEYNSNGYDCNEYNPSINGGNHGFNPLMNGYRHYPYNVVHNHKTVVNTNPYSYKSTSEIEEEIEMLKKKVENNKNSINNLSNDTRVIVENIIADDEMKLNELKHELEFREKSLSIPNLLLILFFIVIILTVVFSIIAVGKN